MPTYNCETCNFSSKLKGNYIQHLNTKKHQRNLERITSENEKNNKNNKKGHKKGTNGKKNNKSAFL